MPCSDILVSSIDKEAKMIMEALKEFHEEVLIELPSKERTPVLSQAIQEDQTANAQKNFANDFFGESSSIIFVLEPRSKMIQFPAPPPKLFYTTFWRSITRRMYRHHREMFRRTARQT